MKYDFIEIGTSDFETEIESCGDESIGLSIEPISRYLNRLPDKKNVIKVNCAVSNYDGFADIYYVSEENIVNNNLPDFVRGCNSINKPHPVYKGFVFGLNIPDELITIDKIPVKRFESLVNEYDIESINFLKIDTEGHDCVILNDYLDICDKKPELLSKKILFESNELTNKVEVEQLINRLVNFGYKIIKSDNNTIVEL